MSKVICMSFLSILMATTLLYPNSTHAQDETFLREMSYVATQVATDIFVGTVLENVESIESGESGNSSLFPRFDTFYRAAVGTVVKGSASTGGEVQIRHRGGEFNGEVDYGDDIGPLEVGQRCLFVMKVRDGEDY